MTRALELLGKLGRFYDEFRRQRSPYRTLGIPLRNNNEEIVGFIDQIKYNNNHIEIFGWCQDIDLHVINGSASISITNRFERKDVETVFPELKSKNHNTGFYTKIINVEKNLTLGAQNFEKNLVSANLIKPTSKSALLYEPLLFLNFLFKESFLAVRASRTIRISLIKHILKSKLICQADTFIVPKGYLHTKDTTKTTKLPPIFVIIPIYRQRKLAIQCIDSVLDNAAQIQNIILIDDCSRDERLSAYLNKIDDEHNKVTLIQNSENIGFVKSVNRGLDICNAHNGDALILNSDVIVTNEWVKSLRDVQKQFPKHELASITPLSNSASILSCKTKFENVSEIEANYISDKLRSVNLKPVQIPSGVGFCMLMTHAALSIRPKFDEVFGMGYGEEVDWCQYLVQHGMVHAVANNSYIIHLGTASFDVKLKEKNLSTSSRIINGRYPNFLNSVDSFERTHSLFLEKFLVTLLSEKFYSQNPIKLFVGHRLGGGAEAWLNRKLEVLRLTEPVLVMRPSYSVSCQLELHLKETTKIIEFEDLQDAELLLKNMRPLNIVYSCAVSFSDPLAILDLLSNLSALGTTKSEIFIHDFFMVSPNYTLVGTKYALSNFDESNTSYDLNSKNEMSWRKSWRTFLGSCENIYAFSESSREIFKEVYPELTEKVSISTDQPNFWRSESAEVSDDKLPIMTVGVLGNINTAKGLLVIERLASLIKSREKDCKIVIIGNVERQLLSNGQVLVHGSYNYDQLTQVIEKYQIDAWLMPSIWPETFSHTVREMASTGKRVYAFDVGAQSEFLKSIPNGVLLQNNLEPLISDLCDAY